MSVVRKISKGKTFTHKDNVIERFQKKIQFTRKRIKKEFYFINLSHGYGVVTLLPSPCKLLSLLATTKVIQNVWLFYLTVTYIER